MSQFEPQTDDPTPNQLIAVACFAVFCAGLVMGASLWAAVHGWAWFWSN